MIQCHQNNIINLTTEITNLIDKVFIETEPESIFLYGSRTWTDYLKTSDYEIGLLYKRKNKVSRTQLAEMVKMKKVNLFPFIYEDFIKYNPDTPFQKALYMRDLICKAKTLKGREVVEDMKLPAITLLDLLEESSFQVASALSAVFSSRQLDWVTTTRQFTKSVFYGLRVLEILKLKKYPVSYKEIMDQAKNIVLDKDFRDLIKKVIQVRQGKKPDIQSLYRNITFQNKIVLSCVRSKLNNGNKVIIK